MRVLLQLSQPVSLERVMYGLMQEPNLSPLMNPALQCCTAAAPPQLAGGRSGSCFGCLFWHIFCCEAFIIYKNIESAAGPMAQQQRAAQEKSDPTWHLPLESLSSQPEMCQACVQMPEIRGAGGLEEGDLGVFSPCGGRLWSLILTE